MSRNKMRQNGTLFQKLSTQQMNMIAALVSGGSVTEAAEKAKIGRTTVYRWMENHAFAAEVNRLKLERRERIRARCGAMLDEALEKVH